MPSLEMNQPISGLTAQPPIVSQIFHLLSRRTHPRRVTTPLNQIASEPENYRHVPFQAMGSARVILGPIQPLPVRRFTLEDDEA